MREQVRTFVIDLVTAIELAFEQGAGLFGVMTIDLDALALANVVCVGKALWDSLRSHESDPVIMVGYHNLLIIILLIQAASEHSSIKTSLLHHDILVHVTSIGYKGVI